MIVPTWAKYAAPLAAGLLIGWTANGWRIGEKVATAESAANHERAESFRYVLAEQTRSAQAMAEADRQATERMTDADAETEQLKRCIATGSGCGLRVRVAKCPGNVPEAGAAAGVGDRGGEWAELSGETSLDILDLETELRKRDEALSLCVSRWPK